MVFVDVPTVVVVGGAMPGVTGIGTESKANALASADLLFGTPDEVNRRYDKLTAVTAADVKRVAEKYFAPVRRNGFAVLPSAMQPKADTTK